MGIQYNILQRGFKNLPDDANPTGFQLLVKSNYYRGVVLSLIEDVEVSVDGVRFERSRISFHTGGRTYRLHEMEQVSDVHWPWLEPATVSRRPPRWADAGGTRRTRGRETQDLVHAVQSAPVLLPREARSHAQRATGRNAGGVRPG